jgi:hypothetical protein
MDDLRLPAVAARLVAWHNRHPLARRITALQVHAIGYVAVPFVGAGALPPTLDDVVEGAGGSLRERAQAQTQARTRQAESAPAELPLDRRTLTSNFSENFIDPLTPRQVARFALRAGRVLARPPADGPVRQVRADGGGATLQVYLLTAVIETGTRKSRVLLGAGDSAPVLGYRVFSTPRLAAVVAPLAVAAAVLFVPMRPAAPPAVVVAQAPAASAPPAAGAAEAASAPASSAAADEAPTAPPVPIDVEPRLGRIELPDLRAHVTRVNKDQAFRSPDAPPRAPAEAASSAEPAPPPAPPPAPSPASPPPRAAPTPPAGPAYAVSTRPLRTRAEADQVRVAMVSLLKTVAADEVHVDVLPEGDDWRVVGLPFPSRAAADKARGLLVSRGMRVEVLGF